MSENRKIQQPRLFDRNWRPSDCRDRSAEEGATIMKDLAVVVIWTRALSLRIV